MFTDNFDAYNRPYKGDNVCNRNKTGVVYDIKFQDDVMVCYVCGVDSDQQTCF